MHKDFKTIILKRYSDKEFAKLYYDHSKNGLKPYESFLINHFLLGLKEILVIGCGCGREVIPLVKKGYNVTAIDLSEEMVKKTKNICQEFKAKAKILQMDGADLKFESSSFDAILLFNCTIDQVPGHENRKKLVAEAHRVLKSGGICIAVSNNAFYPGKKFNFWIEHIKEIIPFIKNKKEREFFDRIYKDNNQEVYVHLSSPFYLKRLFGKYFKVILETSAENILKNKKSLKKYFAPNCIIVCRGK